MLKKVKGGHSYIGDKKLKNYPTIEAILGLRKLNGKIKTMNQNDFKKIQNELKKFKVCNFLFQ